MLIIIKEWNTMFSDIREEAAQRNDGACDQPPLTKFGSL
jgi:hypothetical protein